MAAAGPQVLLSAQAQTLGLPIEGEDCSLVAPRVPLSLQHLLGRVALAAWPGTGLGMIGVLHMLWPLPSEIVNWMVLVGIVLFVCLMSSWVILRPQA